jgi:hypothetical protein
MMTGSDPFSAGRTTLGPVVLLCLLGLVACGQDDQPAPASQRCVPPTGVSGSPSNIADTVALSNALLAAHPEKLTLSCFVESLDRPLGALAVSSLFSAQPAVGARSPRMFFFSGNLVMSVAVAGIGSALLELAEYTTPTRSIKGEIEFPLAAPVTPAAPYERIVEGTGTSCGGCHRSEKPRADLASAPVFESDVLRPRSRDEISLPWLKGEALACDRKKEPQRCAMLSAIFDHGELVDQKFSPDANTIFY